MIKVNIIKTKSDIIVSINGHANYGDAPASDGNMYEKVCACVTLISLTIQDYCYKNDIGCEVSSGYLKAVISHAKFSETLDTCISQLYLLNNITKHYIDIEVKEIY